MANVDIAALIVRGCCETDKADPDHQDTVCINVGDLSRVVIGVLDDEQPNGGADDRKNTLIGNLLDHWQGTPNDLKAEMREFGCGKQLGELFQYMEYEQPAPNGGAGAVPADYSLIHNTELMALRRRADVAIRVRDEEVWFWQGDGYDFPESLVCPVVMSAAALRELLSKGAGAEDARDAARLDFVVDNGAFIYTKRADSGADTYQLWNQDENEEHHVLSGKNRFYATKREAIDAAMSDQNKGSVNGC